MLRELKEEGGSTRDTVVDLRALRVEGRSIAEEVSDNLSALLGETLKARGERWWRSRWGNGCQRGIGHCNPTCVSERMNFVGKGKEQARELFKLQSNLDRIN